VELDRPAVDRVLRRASELAPPPPGTLASFSGISEEVLLAAAAEVGLDPGAVRVSLAIERLGPVAPATRADRVLGAPDIVIDRLVALDATAAIDRLDRLLVLEHQLRPRRTRPDAREWHRQRGTVGAARRVAKTMAGGSGLSKVARLQATASAVDEQRTVLRLVADRRSQRSGVATAGAVTGGLAAVGLGVAAVAVSSVLIVATPLAVVAAVGVARKGREQAADLACELDAALDAVEMGTAPVTLTDTLRRVIRETRRR